MVRLAGIEPTLLAPEASALSTELQAHNRINKPLLVYHIKLISATIGVKRN